MIPELFRISMQLPPATERKLRRAGVIAACVVVGLELLLLLSLLVGRLS